MAEPTSTAVAAVAGTVLLTGGILGLEFGSMLAGFVGALVAQTFVPAEVAPVADRPLENRLRTIWRTLISQALALWQLIAAGLLAGFLAPLAVALAQRIVPSDLPADPLRLAVGFVLGILAPIAVPVIRKFAERKGETL